MSFIYANNIPICTVTLGTGGAINSDSLLALLDKYYELGGRTVDTARMYDQLGQPSEAVIGYWLKSRSVRSDITLVTKGGFPRERMKPNLIKDDIEQSLDLLGCAPDIYLLHRDEPTTHVGEFVELCNRFTKQGYTKAWGLSNWDNDRISEAKSYAKNHGLVEPCLSQIQWSLAVTTGKRAGDDTLVCMNEERKSDYAQSGMAVMAFASQAKGFFSKYASGAPFSQKVIDRFVSPKNLERAERVRMLSNELGVSAAAVAISYIVSAGLNSATVVGCLNEAQLCDSMTALNLNLTKEQCQYLYGG